MELKTVEDLKNAIKQIEYEQSIQKKLLKEQVLALGESLKLPTLIKDSIKIFYSTSLEKARSKGIIGFITAKLFGAIAKRFI
jgi:hypothetical protein